MQSAGPKPCARIALYDARKAVGESDFCGALECRLLLKTSFDFGVPLFA
jgi:hypothetical protein